MVRRSSLIWKKGIIVDFMIFKENHDFIKMKFDIMKGPSSESYLINPVDLSSKRLESETLVKPKCSGKNHYQTVHFNKRVYYF